MDFTKKTLADLRVIAKEKGIKGVTGLKKQELIEVLSADEDKAQKEIKPKAPAKSSDKAAKEAQPRAAKEAQPKAAKGTQPRAAKEAQPKAAKGTQPKAAKGTQPKAAKGTQPKAAKETQPKAAKETQPKAAKETQPKAASVPAVNNSSEKSVDKEQKSTSSQNQDNFNKYSEANSSRTKKPVRPARNAMTKQPGGSHNNTHSSYVSGGNTSYGSNGNGYNSGNNNGNNSSNSYNASSGYNNSSNGSGSYRRSSHSENDIPKGANNTSYLNNPTEMEQLDSGEVKSGILEVMGDGYGFIRCDNYLPGEQDVYVSPALIRRFLLRTGDIIVGNTRVKNQNEKFSALLFLKSVNGHNPNVLTSRPKFEDLVPIFPNERIHLETAGAGTAMRMVDLVSPIGKGQRGMIVSQPKTGKTTLLKQVAKAVKQNHPEMHLIILLIDERPEEVTDIKESIEGEHVEVIYSTFDELPDNHKRVSEMVIERAKRLVEHGNDVMILLDSITRLARAYNLTVQPSGRTLSGGLDPAALHMPKRFFGAARNMRGGGSLTILATALVDTGSRMDDVVFEEFKGTGNMELVLDRNLSEKRIFPAIDLPRSSTRRDDLLLTQPEMEASFLMRRAMNGMKSDEAVEQIINMFVRTKNNNEFVEMIKKVKIV